MNQIKVSVIIPVYNAQDYLRQCLDSVCHQSLKEIEIICVDDGSTDDSRRILDEYAASDPRIQILSQNRQYAGAARNLGMAKAHGKYLIFWDSDDYFHEKALELLYNQCEADKAQIGICGACKYDQVLGFSYTAPEYLFKDRLPQKMPFNKYDIGRYLFNFCANVPWNKMYLRSFVEESGLQFQALPQGNDLYFVMMSLFLADSLTVVDRALIYYRIANQASITGKTAEHIFSVSRAITETYQALCRYPQFVESFRQSFRNKAVVPLLTVLRLANDVSSARSLYKYYQTELFPQLGLYGHKAEYFSNPEVYEEVTRIREDDFETFVLYQLRLYDDKFNSMRGRYQKEKNILRKTERRLDDVLHSSSYRVGKAMTFLPRRLKNKFHHKNSDGKPEQLHST